jgi:methylenetetrahydrofolate dehydrogenase (NADP+) / methenyltetrahydrofolate cyclohydrolase
MVMSAQIIDGRVVADVVYRQLSMEINALKIKGIIPRLVVILVGDDPASIVYVGNKQKACENNGILSETIKLDASISEADLVQCIEKTNHNKSVHGILVQFPLPPHIAADSIIPFISPDKDVDGIHPINRGKLSAGQDCYLPCTPAGIQRLLLHYGYSPEGKHVVVIGRSAIVGMPFAIMMMQKKNGANATVTLCHTGSGDLRPLTLQADILVAAIGKPNTIKADMVKTGAVVIDVGTNRVQDRTKAKGYRLVGDVEFDSVKEVAAAISPVPGGVGPMTIAMLLANTVKAAKALAS